MIYIVSGYMRTGTSMMMDALRAGGLTAVFNQKRDEMNCRFGDENYMPNAHGFYELRKSQMWETGFPKMYDGKLIKILQQWLRCLSVHEYRVVFMLRNPEEIRQSFEAFFGRTFKRFDETLRNYDNIMTEQIVRLKNRRDVVSIDIFQYREVVEKPKHHFERLVKASWPIDVEKATSIVDPVLCRFKLEMLEPGI